MDENKNFEIEREEDKYDIVQRCKYLDDLGIPVHKYGTNFLEKNDKRIKKYRKQRKKYGFDSRETWNLDSMFAEWLYTRCKMFLKEAQIVDLSYHKFEYNGKIYTQEKAIKKIIKWSKYYILHKWGSSPEKETKAYEKMKKAAELWAIIMPSMWW